VCVYVCACVRMKTHKISKHGSVNISPIGTPLVAINIRREECFKVSTDDRAAPLPVQLQQLADNGMVEILVKKGKVQ
jgi:hypothetical protein